MNCVEASSTLVSIRCRNTKRLGGELRGNTTSTWKENVCTLLVLTSSPIAQIRHATLGFESSPLQLDGSLE